MDDNYLDLDECSDDGPIPPMVAQVRILLANRQKAVSDVTSYLTEFTGRFFEVLADREEPDEFTARDLLAVTALSVVVPPGQVDWMLNEARGSLSSDLSQISNTAEIGIQSENEDFETLLGKNSPAVVLWKRLRKRPGIGPVVAGKLLAAKRPKLIPIFDSIIYSQLRPRDREFWQDMWETMALPDVRAGLRAIQADASESEPMTKGLSLLRVLDIVAWREGRRQVG